MAALQGAHSKYVRISKLGLCQGCSELFCSASSSSYYEKLLTCGRRGNSMYGQIFNLGLRRGRSEPFCSASSSSHSEKLLSRGLRGTLAAPCWQLSKCKHHQAEHSRLTAAANTCCEDDDPSVVVASLTLCWTLSRNTPRQTGFSDGAGKSIAWKCCPSCPDPLTCPALQSAARGGRTRMTSRKPA